MTETHHARVALSVRNPEKSQSCADYLQSLGFQIMSVGNRGVDFKGSFELFTSTFKVPVGEGENGLRFKGCPLLDEQLTTNNVDSVYFPNPPSFFKGKRKE